jgi:hypothetical protein
MHFFAKIDTNSAIHRTWRSNGQVSGLLEGVLFRWDSMKKVYAATEILPENIESFKARQDKAVILETLQYIPQRFYPAVVEPLKPTPRRVVRRRQLEE